MGENKDLARRMAVVVDGLAEYDHLTGVGRVEVVRGGSVQVTFFPWENPEQRLAEWAAAFDQPVTIDLTGMGGLCCSVPIAGEDVQLVAQFVNTRRAYDLGVALQVDPTQSNTVQVFAGELLAALAESTDAQAVSHG